MIKNIFLILFNCALLNTQAQIENHIKKIEKASTEIQPAINYFLSDCLVNNNSEKCVNSLIAKASNNYQKYIVANVLYNISPKKSNELHKSVYTTLPNELNIVLEYAMESHRIGNYTTAIKLYQKYHQEKKDDYRVNVWLSECFLNLNNYSEAIKYWKKANHSKNHVGIDKAIYTIHGRTDQIKKRSDLITKVLNKDVKSAYELIFLDMNWEIDWWNSQIQEYFAVKDLSTIKKVFGSKSKEYIELSTYKKIKELSKTTTNSKNIKTALLKANLILNNAKIPNNGVIASDLLRISFINKLLEQKSFFKARGKELMELSDKLKDQELLNIYAYLESITNGRVSEKTDKKGWQEYHSEKFAISYFIGLANKNRYDNPDLGKAIQDFPNSSNIHWVKLNCAKIESKNLIPDLIAVLKKEFKTLKLARGRSSYGLKNYFYLLEKEMNK